MLPKKQTRVLLSATNFSFAARITSEATTCLVTNLNSMLVIGCREAHVNWLPGPLAPMIIPGSQHSNLTINNFFELCNFSV